jgi:hypothetical protein
MSQLLCLPLPPGPVKTFHSLLHVNTTLQCKNVMSHNFTVSLI